MVQCPYCKAEFNISVQTQYITCPYCGTVFQISTGNIKSENHFFYPINIDSTLAFKNLLSFLSRQYGAPKNINESSLSKRTLHYLPLHLYEGRGYAKCPNSGEIYYETHDAFLALLNPPIPIGHEYKFPIRGKEYFKPNVLEYGRYYNPEIQENGFNSFIESTIYSRVSREAMLSCMNPQINVNVKYEGLIHYPFWELIYDYSNSTYKGIVDAVDGIVVYAEYPQELGYRRIFATIGVTSIIAGLIIGGITGVFMNAPLLGILGGTIGGIASGFRLILRSMKQRVKVTQLKERMGTEKEELKNVIDNLRKITLNINI